MKYIKKAIPIEAFKYKGDFIENGNIVFLNGQLKRMKMACFILKMMEVYIFIHLKVK